MKAAKTWCIAGLALVAGLSTASCGKDEIPGDGSAGKGMIIGGGGNGGSAGGRSMAGTGGGGTSSGPATKLGRACVSNAECDDSTAPGLICITSKDAVLGDGAPPKGLCTFACDSDDACAPFGAGALCYPFGSDADTGYCVEGCSFGTPDLGSAKCHSRPEFACNPALLGKTNATCAATADCQAGELCIDGTCDVVFPACLPGCRGDIDCDDGMYCDQSFLSGVCLAKAPTGKALGEPCTVPPDSAPSEPDECLGFCQADDATGVKGHCATTCGLGNECAWNSDTKVYDGLCLYASVLTADTGDTGDFGFCTPSCNCSADCNDATLGCSLLQMQMLPTESFRGAGLCFTPGTEPEYDHCTDTGGGGAGGGGDAGGAAGSSPGGMSAGGAGGAP